MQAADIKHQLQDLAGRRSAIEKEVAEASARLDAAGVGMHASLVDNEGFPRADIDIPSIRSDRHKVIVLTNDHKELTNQMESLLHKLHAITRDTGVSTLTTTTAASNAATDPASTQNINRPVQQIAVLATADVPFAVIDELSEGSPASSAGLKLGDRMLRFAHVTYQTPDTLQAVARTLAASEGKVVEAIVLRDGVKVNLKLVPQKWEGRGLLGCHLQPTRQ